MEAYRVSNPSHVGLSAITEEIPSTASSSASSKRRDDKSFVRKFLSLFENRPIIPLSRGSNLGNGSSSSSSGYSKNKPGRHIINNKADNIFGNGENIILRLRNDTSDSFADSVSPSISSLDPGNIFSSVVFRGAENARYYLPAHLLKRIGVQKGLTQDELYEASRRVYDPTTNVIKEGYLEKQGYTNINLWKRRYFVLKDSGLFWFEEQSQFQEKAPPRGMILFLNVLGDIDSGDYLTDQTSADSQIHHKNAVRFYPSNMKNLLGRQHVFALMHVKNGSSDRSFFFSHEHKSELLEWAKALDKGYHNYLEVRDKDIISATAAMRGKPIPLSILHELHKIYDDFFETSGVLARDHLARKILLAWYLHTKEAKMR